MRASTLLSFASAGFVAYAKPTPVPQTDMTEACDVSASQFYLITASSPLCDPNSANIPMAAATSLLRPFRQAQLLLRTIGEGYLSLPTFTFSDGALHTIAGDALGQGEYPHSTIAPVEGQELQFLRDQAGDANLTLTGGFLLGVGGVTDGWKLCEGPVGDTSVVRSHS